jgi:ribosome-binding protein aMBF1 (putative translation factor)
VYGREVTDLRSVDYDAIAMLNVSATQQLAKKLEEKDAVITALEARLSALEKRFSNAK